MAEKVNGIGVQERLSRLARAQQQGRQEESALVAASGAAPPAWLIEVVDNVEYNLYEVQQVRIITTGLEPLAVGGSTTQAFNVAESFTSAGTISAGTYAVMWRVGERNVFYVRT